MFSLGLSEFRVSSVVFWVRWSRLPTSCGVHALVGVRVCFVVLGLG